MKIVTRVKKLLIKAQKGEADVSDKLVEEFGELCKDAFSKHFKPHSREWYIRMSQLGKSIRAQQCEKLGLPKDRKPEDEPWLTMKFLMGDMLEAAAISIMKAAGVNIEVEQGEVSLDLEGQTIPGTYDIKVDGGIIDIKSASPYSFKFKFGKGFEELVNNDPFGYVMQGYLYSEADNSPFTGWLVIEKSTGEWLEVKANDKYKTRYLDKAKQNIKTLNDTHTIKDIKKDLPIVEEVLRGKPTGRLHLHTDYTFFDYKKVLWEDKVEYRKEVGIGKAKWYIKE